MRRFYFFLIPLLLQSCSSMYIPAVRSIPLLEKKGEFQGEAGVSTNSVYANGSYAFTNHIAASINGNLSYRNFSSWYDLFSDIPSLGIDPNWESGGKFAHRYGEVSLGKINMITSRAPKLEIFGGMGMGRATDTRSNYYYDYYKEGNYYECDYYSFFGQGNFGIKKRIFEAGVSMRLAYSRFSYAATNSGEDFSFQNKFGAFHLEPMGFIRVGGKNLKFVYRIGTHLAFTNNTIEYPNLRGFDDNGKLEYTIFHCSIGISYRISGK